MAIDRDNQYQVQSIVVGATDRQQFNIFEASYIMVYNNHATAIVTVYSTFSGARGITVPPGGFRSLPRMPDSSMLWILSDTADTTVEMWTSQTKWASDFMASELTTHIDALSTGMDPVTGDTVNVPGDPTQLSTVAYTYDFITTLGRYARFVTFVCESHTLICSIRLRDDTAITTFQLAPGRSYSEGDTGPIEIESIELVPVGIGAWDLNLRAW